MEATGSAQFAATFGAEQSIVLLLASHHRTVAADTLVAGNAGEGIMLGPGELFLVEPHPTGWLRFNVAFSNDERHWRFLDARIAAQAHAVDDGIDASRSVDAG